jgi:hypothetical protein
MNYFVVRGGAEYGPYTLTDLQRYVASGHVAPSDLAHGEGSSDLVPVSQIVGGAAVPAVAVGAPPVLNTGAYPDPPNLHWALVLVFDMLTCGLFSMAWNLVQAAWMKRIDPKSTAMNYYIVACCVLAGIFLVSLQGGYRQHHPPPAVGLLNLAYVVLLLIGRFSLKGSLEQHYNTREPFGLVLSGVMTFFFGEIYFQYHLNEIMRRKQAARMGLPSA